MRLVFDKYRPAMQDLMGPLFLTTTNPLEDGFSVLPSIIPADTVVPIHSHADREVLVVIQGVLTVWLGGQWRTFTAGEIVDIAPHARHSLRNDSGEDISMLLVTTPTMKRFLEETGIPAAEVLGPPDNARIGSFVTRALAYGYWLGTPEDQAALGLPQVHA